MSNDRPTRAERVQRMRQERERAERRRRMVISVSVVAAVAVVLAIGGWVVSATTKDDSRPYVAPAHVSSGYTVVDRSGTATAATARTLDAYEDFSCSACKGFETSAGATLRQEAAAGRIVLAMHPVAILDRVSSTEYSTRATNAAVCVLDEGGVSDYVTMHRLLFADQPAEGGKGLSDATLVKLAGRSGVTGHRLRTCVADRAFEPWVKRATKAFTAKHSASTPTLVVAGKQIHGPTYQGNPTVPSLAQVQRALGLAD